MFKVEEVPDQGSIVYRLVHKDQLNRKTRVPSEKMFIPDNDGLSVDWSRHTTPHVSLVRQGITYKIDTTIFKDPNNFLVFELNVIDVKALNEKIGLIHTPTFNGDPAPVGSPNNQSHCSIVGYTAHDEEIRVKLRDMAQQIEGINYEQINSEVAVLRGTQK